MKQLIAQLIRKAVFAAPWGAREAMLSACIDRLGIAEVYGRIAPRLKLAEIAAEGDRGLMYSAGNDTMVLIEYAMTGTFAHTVTETMADFFANSPDGGTFIDIGANIGLTTVPIARNSRVNCLAFEPEPRNFGFLQRNIARNAPGGSVALHQVALFRSRGTMSLSVAEGNIGDHRVTQAPVTGRRSIEIETKPLDDYLDQVRTPLAIKMDTQGAEPHIIAGGQGVFGKAGLIAIEFCPYLMKQLGGDPNVVIELLSGFDRIAIMPGGRAVTPEYLSVEDAQRMLREQLRAAADSDSDYLDILARRDAV